MIEKGTYIFSLWYIFIFFDFNVALDLICKICVSFDMYSKFEIYIINRELFGNWTMLKTLFIVFERFDFHISAHLIF